MERLATGNNVRISLANRTDDLSVTDSRILEY